MFIVMNVWSGSRPLASAPPSILDPHWDSAWIFYYSIVSWRSCSFRSAGLPLHVFPQFIDRVAGGVEVYQLIDLDLNMGCN